MGIFFFISITSKAFYLQQVNKNYKENIWFLYKYLTTNALCGGKGEAKITEVTPCMN